MKNKSRGYLILAILLITISVIAFVVPTEKTATFFVAYAFTVLAFIAQILLWKRALGPQEMKSKFLGFPILHIGIVYLIVQMVAFLVFLAAPAIPTWCAVVVCLLIAAIAALCIIPTDAAVEEIERIGKKVEEKVFFIKSLQVDVEMLAEREEDAATKQALYRLAEKISFSDPISHEQLAELEGQISAKMAKLKIATDKTDLVKELGLLLDERNMKCRILK